MQAARPKKCEERVGPLGPIGTAASNGWCTDLHEFLVHSADQGISVRVNDTPGLGCAS